VAVNGSMPGHGREVIGTKVTIPYFGTVPAFTPVAEGNSGTPGSLTKTHEEATIGRSYCGVQLSRWFRHGDDDDAYTEMARQVQE
ncbi:hypothetical protein, partial [Kingella denitrificans]|uniref:hypothetical protein n=1 Tax=Kingella denitrificans TaxID=502 RepID=UPI001C9BB6C2